MGKRKQRSKRVAGSPEPATNRPAEEPADSTANDTLPQQHNPDAPQIVLSVAIVIHFAMLLFALMANLAPSFWQGLWMERLSPYLVTVHQSYGAIPLELTHGVDIDFPLKFEVREDATNQWKEVLTNVQSPQQTRWTSLSRIVSLIVEDQPDSEMLTELSFQMLRHVEAREKKSFDAVRWLRPHVPTFDEDAVIRAGQGTLIENDLQNEVIFSAVVVRGEEAVMGLVPQQEASRTAPAVIAEAGP